MAFFHRTRMIFGFAALVLFLAGAAVLAYIGKKQMARADILWNNVHGRCVPDMLAHGVPAPCVSVDLTGGEHDGFVVWKDAKGISQYLVLPTQKITGIESPALLSAHARNYFADAWTTTALVNQRLHRTLPRTDFALAVNAISGRTQNQLHIHIDCIQPEVKSLLAQTASGIGTSWQAMPVRLAGHSYRAMWLPGAELGPRNPFQLLAGSLSNPAREMAGHTLVLAGAERKGQPGFVLLDRKAPMFAVDIAPWIRLGFGSGEELEDHSCRVGQGS